MQASTLFMINVIGPMIHSTIRQVDQFSFTFAVSGLAHPQTHICIPSKSGQSIMHYSSLLNIDIMVIHNLFQIGQQTIWNG